MGRHRKRALPRLAMALAAAAFLAMHPAAGSAHPAEPERISRCLKTLTPADSFALATSSGDILSKKNETAKQVPASTLKLVTALTALERQGRSYRFPTRFYQDEKNNLKVKGYGDPLLVSEVWKEMASELARRISSFNDLIVDATYFSRDIEIPGRERSANPYDAPVGALCANFNTVFFVRDKKGAIVSGEPETPLIPFSLERIQARGLREGRNSFTLGGDDAARYAGGLLLHFLETAGVRHRGEVKAGRVGPGDILLFTHWSKFTLGEAVAKMMEFSNNFVANQIFLALGAHVLGPPATLEKGVAVVMKSVTDDLGLRDIMVVEGSGISPKNRFSALDMLSVLERFTPYRDLLKSQGRLRFKTGTLSGISARAGFIEAAEGGSDPYRFVIFLRRGGGDIDVMMRCLSECFNGGRKDER